MKRTFILAAFLMTSGIMGKSEIADTSAFTLQIERLQEKKVEPLTVQDSLAVALAQWAVTVDVGKYQLRQHRIKLRAVTAERDSILTAKFPQ